MSAEEAASTSSPSGAGDHVDQGDDHNNNNIVNEDDPDPFDVYLNIYDVSSSSINPFLRYLGLAFYLSCVQVHGREYMYRADNGDGTESGIVSRHKNQLPWTQGLNLRKSILIGRTQMDLDQVQQLMQDMRNDHNEGFNGHDYHLLTNNSHHFCDHLCKQLTNKGIPWWVNTIAKTGRVCKCIIPVDELNAEVRRNGHSSDDEAAEPYQVYLNVYNVNSFASPLLRLLGIGLYRSTVQVHGREYAFRPRPEDGSSNEYIISVPKGQLGWVQGLKLHKFIHIGHTQLGPQMASTVIYGLQTEFNLVSYNHITKNCNHFSDAVCKELISNEIGIPSWVNRISKIWFVCKWFLPKDPEARRTQERRSPRNML